MNLDNYSCSGQLTIFDLLPPEDDLNIPIEEAARIIGSAIGVKMVWNDFFKEFQGKTKEKIIICISYSRYLGCNDERKFLGVDVNYKTAGAGSPCDSIPEAIEYIRKQIDRFRKEEEKDGKSEKHIRTA